MQPDRDYFDGKFAEVHKRITDSDKENAKEMANLNTKFTAHCASPCPDLQIHITDCHKDSATKTWTLTVLITSFVLSVWAFIKSGGKAS